ncbi:23S rRNA (cytidine-2'-O)-methyltransferase TlyA [Helicobacter sp. 23-1045]
MQKFTDSAVDSALDSANQSKNAESMRLDIFLHKNGFTQSRNQSVELIKNGFVCVNGRVILKPSFLVQSQDLAQNLKILKNDIFVSRAGEKLESFFKNHSLNLQGLSVIDIGSAKGGFAQVALKYGAKSVVCVDVGSNQLDSALRQNPKIRFYENCAIADFHANQTYDFVLCDVSFVSLHHILPDIKRLCADKALLLFKPQFEVGKNVKRNKKGVVVDKSAILETLESFKTTLKANDFKVLCAESCAIKGKEGNEEIFIYIQK